MMQMIQNQNRNFNIISILKLTKRHISVSYCSDLCSPRGSFKKVQMVAGHYIKSDHIWYWPDASTWPLPKAKCPSRPLGRFSDPAWSLMKLTEMDYFKGGIHWRFQKKLLNLRFWETLSENLSETSKTWEVTRSDPYSEVFSLQHCRMRSSLWKFQ